MIGISPPTLRLHYREVLDVAASKANAKATESTADLVLKLMGGDAASVNGQRLWIKDGL